MTAYNIERKWRAAAMAVLLFCCPVSAQRAWVVNPDGITPPEDLFGRQPFEWGFAATGGAAKMIFPGLAFNGKAGFDYGGGLSFQVNCSQLVALRTDILYNRTISRYPTPDNFYTSYEKFKQSILYIPVNLLLMGEEKNAVTPFAGFGGHYALALTSSVGSSDILDDVNRNRWGMNLCFGSQTDNFSLMLIYNIHLGKLFCSEYYPEARLNRWIFILAYRF